MFSSATNIGILQEALDIYVKEYVESLPEDQELQNYTFSEEFEKKMIRLIKFQKKSYFKYVNTIGKRVATIVLVSVICLFVTVLSVKALREPFINFVVETFEKFTSIFVEKDTPDGIEFKIMLPQYIPEGYVAEELPPDDKNAYMCRYRNMQGDILFYTQEMNDFSQITADTENTIYQKIYINDLEGLFYKNKDMNCLVFGDEMYTFSVSGYLSKDELIKIAKSIKIN